MLNYQPLDAPTADAVFHALGDPTRRSIVDQLCRRPASVSELAAPLEMSLPAVMQHLDVLQSSGLVRSAKVGRVRTCTIEPERLRAVEGWIAQRRTFWEEQLDRLGELLAEDDEHPQPKKGSRR